MRYTHTPPLPSQTYQNTAKHITSACATDTPRASVKLYTLAELVRATLKPAPPASPPHMPTHRRCIKIHLTTRHLTDTPAPNSNSHPSLKSCARRTNRLRRHRHNQELPTLPCISTKKNTDTPRALLRLSPSLNSSAPPLKSPPPPSSRSLYLPP